MDLNFRVQRTAEYFQAVRELRNESWLTVYDRHVSGGLSLQQSLVLVHPMWAVGTPTPYRAKRTFSFAAAKQDTCASEELWGYACPLDGPIHVDHLFPYGLGGPTHPANAVYLCRDHNLAKGHDVHLHPWTPDRFTWLDAEINATHAFVVQPSD